MIKSCIESKVTPMFFYNNSWTPESLKATIYTFPHIPVHQRPQRHLAPPFVELHLQGCQVSQLHGLGDDKWTTHVVQPIWWMRWNKNMRETILVTSVPYVIYIYIVILFINEIQHQLIFTCSCFNCLSLPTAIKRMTTLRPSHRLISANHNVPQELNTKQRVV